MKITLRTKDSDQRIVIQTDEGSTPPAMIKFPGENPHQIAMDWDGALDDEKCLRRCPACSCKDMYISNNFHQITVLVTIALAAVILLIFLYHDLLVPALIVLGVSIVVDVLIYIFKRPALVCYSCKSEFRSMPIAKHHKRWEQSTGNQYNSN